MGSRCGTIRGVETVADIPQDVPQGPGRARTADHGTRRGARQAPVPGLADPGWTRLVVAELAPVVLAVSSALPNVTRTGLVVLLVPLLAQGWPALVRARHDVGSSVVIALAGVSAALVVGVTGNFATAAWVMAFSVVAAFVAQMLRRDGRPDLVEDLGSTVSGALVAVCGAGWCALNGTVADPSIMVPVSVALFAGALLTLLPVPAHALEILTVTLAALVSGVVGGALAQVGFFGPLHTGPLVALQSAAACLVAGFVAGILMAAGNRVLWTHRWVPGGRAAATSALVPVLATGAPVYAVARLMGSFLAG